MNKFNTSQKDDYERKEINLLNENYDNKQDLYERVSYKTLKRRSVVPNSRIMFFIFGVCLGMALFYIISFNSVDCFKMILNGKEVEQIKNHDINKGLLLLYITEIRIKQLIVVFLCSFNVYNYILKYVMIGFFGIGVGILTFISMYQYGLAGLFFVLIMCFPHFIFYIWTFFCVFSLNESVDKNTYHKKLYNISRLTYYIRKIKKIFVIIILYTLGVLLETYINAELIKKLVIFL